MQEIEAKGFHKDKEPEKEENKRLKKMRAKQIEQLMD